MTIHLDWTHYYETGVDEVDLQHKYFAGLINRLAAELELSEERWYHLRLFHELEAYARFHFISEENIIQRMGLAGLDEHRALHAQLLDQLSAQMFHVKEERTDPMELIRFLIIWFVHHTVEQDQRQFAGVRPLP